MKLWYSNSSPYARKARAVVQYHQLQDHVELLLATSGLDKNSPHNLDNPLGRLPAFNVPIFNSSPKLSMAFFSSIKLRSVRSKIC